ncbi:hypothetical protein O181_121270 [Austropuccinia psidii MF-1]|uniref:Uncharacterized protein n=1 Tax=Austropuccinia psidii MF-1 TaxID=1389203 RepID=A0A9Q3Q259_9BASI|nr:hypothetical protein [Austropuccinia psidii MF-1]
MGSTLIRVPWSSPDPESSLCVSTSSWPPEKRLGIFPTHHPRLLCSRFHTGTDIFLFLPLGNGSTLKILTSISSGSEFTSKLVGTEIWKLGATLVSSRHVFLEEDFPDLALVLPLPCPDLSGWA